MGRKRKQIATRPGYVVYLRTSTEEVQAPQRSQDGQRRDIARMLKYYDDLPFVCEFIDNYTGTSADRKAYQDMLRQAHQGAFSHIFASTPDRFGRDDVEALRAIDELTEMGLTVRFAAHPDLDPSHEDDRLYLNILFGMARRESAVIGRRVKHGMLSKLHQGDWPWKAPDGYLNRESRIDSTDKAESLQHTRYRRWVEIDPARAPIWRYAWDLLLDNKTLPAICEALTACGYRLRNGNPFIRANRRGKLVPNIQALSRAFNNWFYAGWIVVPSEWADIKPKTLRGNWKPIVSTEEFEHGLQLLAQRRQKPFSQKRNFYLLQGLVYLQYPSGKLRRMSCSRPNIKRTENGVAYYRIAGQEQRVICTEVDQQIPYHLKRVQVDSEQIPTIRRVYQQDVHSYTSSSGQESRSLKEALERAKDKELNLWRAYTEHGMHNDVYLKLAQEIQQERTNIENALQSFHQESSSHIEDLDMALHILSQIGERYQLLDRDYQRELLRQLVSKVVIDERGKIIRLELLPPFIYLQAIANGTQIRLENGQIAEKTAQQADFSCSTRIGLGPQLSHFVIHDKLIL
ncbi:MAG: recombinase family protein [Anaerolineae bacterium]|nr:recombinase family protein [Anaerolineae bacterium]